MRTQVTVPAMLLLALTVCAAAPLPGLGVLCLPGERPAGEIAARELGITGFGGAEVALAADGSLEIPEGIKVLWWHCEQGPLPAEMQTSAVKKALVDWLNAGHGLFLSGTALSYVRDLGLEPTSPRMSGLGGSDSYVAGVTPGEFEGHPIYEGFQWGAPVLLVSAGHPAFSDFHGSGGPLGGNVIGLAHGNAGENPLVEHACGQGRIIAMGWRLPFYGLRDNAHRANLEKFTANILRYLAAGEWFGKIEDGRLRMLVARLEMLNVEAMAKAISDLTETYPDAYTRGPEYLKLLDRLPEVKAALRKGDEGAADEAQALFDRVTAAMLDNPLLDFGKLLLVARSEANLGLPQNWDSNSSIAQRGYDNEIAVLSPVRPDGKLSTCYRPGNGEFVGDVDLDFDASRILFSMPAPAGRWQLFEMPLASRSLGVSPAASEAPHQLPLIEEPDVDNYDACYLPDGNLMFTSTAPMTGVPCVTGSSHVAVLYRWDRGGSIRQLAFEQDHDWCPTVLNDGRVLYLRWEYADIPHFVSRILFSMNPDGTNQSEYYGSNSYWPNATFYARPVPGDPSKFVAVVGGHHDNPRMGELVLFDASKAKMEADGVIQRIGPQPVVDPIILDGLTGGSWPKFLHPWPLSDKYFLTACKPTPGSRWGIYLADVFGNLTLIRESETHALLEPIPLRPREKPPVIANKVDPARKDALVYMQDVYRGDGLKGVPRGTIKNLRLYTYHFAYHNMGGQVNRVGIDGPWDVRRIVGTVPVAEDGSAYFRIPANTPIAVLPIDERGQALQLMRSWMTAMPGETLSCVGCHEKRSEAPMSTVRAVAAARTPEEIRPWYGPARGFSFVREVQPVLDRHCLQCHDGTDAARPNFRDLPPIHPPGPQNGYQQGSIFTPSYLALKEYVRNATIESDIHLLMPGEFAADSTWLVQMLRKGHHGVNVDAESWDRILTWIDLNAPAHGTGHEIVGWDLVTGQRDRRKLMWAKYAGREEDPEATFEPTYDRTPVAPAPRPEPGPPVRVEGWPFSAGEAQRMQNAATAVARTVDLGNGTTLDLVSVPAGKFVMGDDRHPDEMAVASSVEKPFWMARCEITNAQYAAFDPAHDSRHEEGDYLQFGIEERGYPTNAPEQPVLRVTWDEAVAFCKWLSQKTGLTVTLPSEQQWEWACRAGSDAPMWFGDTQADFAPFANLADICLKRVDTFAPWGLPSGAIYEWRPAAANVDDGHRVTAPVGSYKPNPWGLRDMIGNAAEWTGTPCGTAGEMVVRGGSFYDPPHRGRSASKTAHVPYRGVFDVGFRVVVE